MKTLLVACLFATILAIHACADGVTLEIGSASGGTLVGSDVVDLSDGYSGDATVSGGTLEVGNGNYFLNGATVGSGTAPFNGTLTLTTFSPGILDPLGTFTLTTLGGLPALFDVTNLTITLDGAILYSPDATFTAGTQTGLYTVAFNAAPEPPTLLLMGATALAFVAMRRRLVRAA